MSDFMMEREIQEALTAGENALQSLYAASEQLDSARNWGIVDLLGGGFFTDLIKHSKMGKAEAEGIDKKAEAMKKYGEAAIIEMIMQALPEIAKNVAEPLSKVDKITMYGEGNSAKMLQDIINSTTQVTEGLAQGMGIDVKALLSSIVGAKIASNTPEDPQKSDSDEYEQ